MILSVVPSHLFFGGNKLQIEHAYRPVRTSLALMRDAQSVWGQQRTGGAVSSTRGLFIFPSQRLRLGGKMNSSH